MPKKIALICLLFMSLTAMSAKRTEAQTYDDIKDRVIHIIAEQTGLPAKDITEDKNFVRDLRMNQEAHEAVRDALSQELGGQTITDEQAEKITTVQRAINFVFIRIQKVSL